jgi:hypothetical protein
MPRLNWAALTQEEYNSVLSCADKSKMHLAPAEVLGPYCAADADSTYLLYTQVLRPALERFKALEKYASPEIYGRYLRILIEQRLRGMLVDREGVVAYSKQLEDQIAEDRDTFLKHPTIAPAVTEYNRRIAEEHWQKEPEKFLKQKALPTEPAQYRKDGQLSKNWLRWNEQKEKATLPIVSKNWEKWWKQLLEILDGQHFNPDSGPQKQWLFYDYLKHPVILQTESGQPATDERALSAFGEPGRLLVSYNEKQKEASYVSACIGHLRESQGPQLGGTARIIDDNIADNSGGSASSGSYYLHAAFRVPGTLTGRLAGAGGFNIQQQPKSREYLKAFRARPGYLLVDLDFTSLENVVLAELSRDPGLWKLYGPGAKPNDAYLFTGAYLPVIGPQIRAAGYDPDNPTVEGIARAKKEAKQARSIAKVVTLASSYGAGAGKIHQTLQLSGIDLSFEEARKIRAGYWELYQGVKRWESELLRQYEKNGGWVLNGIGRPLGIAHGYEKDIVNRVCQSTGHSALVIFLTIVARQLDEAALCWHPWIADFHDEIILEVKEEDAEKAARIMDGPALKELNQLLGGDIPLRGNAAIVTDLAAAKIED